MSRAHLSPDLLQKLRNILAALSLSLSSVVGQNASEPNLLVSLFTGAPNLSTSANVLSNATLPPNLVLSQKVGGMMSESPKTADAEVCFPLVGVVS